MTITVMTDYLVFPVYTYATNKKLVFQYEGETVYSLNIKLDNASPDFYAYIDVARFKGKDIELSVTPEMEISFRETDELDIDNLYREGIRPQIHFTVKNGFLCNPKRLTEKDGIYHLYYQHNPAGREEENLHLGHATSKDLIHWQEEKIAVFPDENGNLDCEEVIQDGACAKLFEIEDDKGNKKWISMDETGSYLVGNIVNGQFAAEQSAQKLRHGNISNAGQILSAQKNGRVICVDWDCTDLPRASFDGQMGIPTELSLKKYNDTYYLQALPIEELGTLYKNTNRYENIKITKGKKVEIPLADGAHLIRLKGNYDETAILDAVLFGRKLRIDFTENQIMFGKITAPISIVDNSLDLTIAVDRCGAEFFADGGKIYFSSFSEDTVMDRNILNLAISCNTEYSLDSAEIHALEPIWQTSPKKV